VSATSRRPSRGTSTTRRTANSTRRRSSSARGPRGYPTRRRSRPGVPSTIGAALGTVIVGALLDMSWPIRLGLLALVLVIGVGYVLWKHRGEIAAAGQQAADEPAEAPPTASAAPPPDPTTPTDGVRP